MSAQVPNQFYQGTLTEGRSEVNCYAVFQNCLYVGGIWRHRFSGGNMLPEPTVWRYYSLACTRPYQDAFAIDAVTDLCVHNNRLYAAALLYQHPPGFYCQRHKLVYRRRFHYPIRCRFWRRGNYLGQRMVSYNGNLYVGITPNVGNTRLYFWDGVSLQTNANLLLNESCNIQAMYVYNNVLFIGTGAAGVGNQGGNNYFLNATAPLVQEYVLPGANTTKRIRSFTSFNGILYANYLAVNIGAPNTGETGILELREVSYFDDVCMSSRQVVLSASLRTQIMNIYQQRRRQPGRQSLQAISVELCTNSGYT